MVADPSLVENITSKDSKVTISNSDGISQFRIELSGKNIQAGDEIARITPKVLKGSPTFAPVDARFSSNNQMYDLSSSNLTW